MFGGKLMDSFKDKIAEKFGTTDVIHANSEAEARELSSVKAQKEELEQAVSEMRRLSLKCAETNETTNQVVQAAIEKIEEIQAVQGGEIPSDQLDEIKAELSSLKEEIAASFKAQEETAHKENVRVYRNVQASLIDELKQQSEAIAIQHLHIEKKMKGLKPIAIIALVFSGISMVGVIAFMVFFLMLFVF